MVLCQERIIAGLFADDAVAGGILDFFSRVLSGDDGPKLFLTSLREV